MSTFLRTANDYLAIQRVAPQTLRHNVWLLERLKPLHPVPVADITAPQLLAALRSIEADGTYNTAHRACSLVGSILRYALAAGLRTQPDVSLSMKGILVTPKGRNRAAITDPAKFGALLQAIDTLDKGSVRDALTLAPHVFVRPCELRGMRWAELNLDAGEWRIPAERMKMRKPFTKYLSAQSVQILRDIWVRSTSSDFSENYVFPGRNAGSISENIMGIALQRLFYSPEEHTPHGFRASASTMLHEAGEDHVTIEAALGHVSQDTVAAAYNRATYQVAQRALHATWSCMVEGMRAGRAAVAA